MATITLTPAHYYQARSGIITSIDPSSKRFDVENYGVLMEFSIPAALKHAKILDGQISLSGVSGDQYRYFQVCKAKNDSYAIGDEVHVGSTIFWGNWYDGTVTAEGEDSPPFGYAAGTTKFFLWMESYGTQGSAHSQGTFTGFSYKFTYQSTPSLAASMMPSTGFINRAAAKTFTFSTRADFRIMVQYTAVSGTLHYKAAGAGSYTDLPMVFADTPYTFDLPANTLAGGTQYEIYATIVADDGSTADTAFGTFSTEDGLPQVTPVAPKNAITEGSALFQWSYYNEKGTQQYAYEIAYTANGGAVQYPTGKVVSNAGSALLSIPEAGTIAWKIRAWNQDDVASDWSDPITFINRIPPSAPTIVDITHAGQPTIYWSAANQIAFQVEVYEDDTLVYNSGEIYSADQSHKIRQFLPDGSYVFRVKILNTFGMSSPWSSADYQQSFSGLPEIVFTAEPAPGGVLITLTPDAAFSRYFLQKNGKTIAELTESTYLDRFVSGTIIYTIVGLTATEAAAFASQEVLYEVTSTTIKTEDGQTIDCSKRWIQRINPQKSVSPEFGLFSYLGASRPVIITSKQRDIRFSFAFADHDRIAESLIGKDLYYSDIFGNAEWTQITAISRSDVWYGDETVLELTAILHDEEIEI